MTVCRRRGAPQRGLPSENTTCPPRQAGRQAGRQRGAGWPQRLLKTGEYLGAGAAAAKALRAAGGQHSWRGGGQGRGFRDGWVPHVSPPRTQSLTPLVPLDLLTWGQEQPYTGIPEPHMQAPRLVLTGCAASLAPKPARTNSR